jgi:hypothetical protein
MSGTANLRRSFSGLGASSSSMLRISSPRGQVLRGGGVTVTDRSALASALRELKLSGMLATLDARLAQAHAGELGHLDFLQVLCQHEITRASPCPWAAGSAAPGSRPRPPSKGSTSPPRVEVGAELIGPCVLDALVIRWRCLLLR